MADTYEVLSQRTATEIDPQSGNLIDTLEVTAKAIPSGATFTRRYPLDGVTPAAVDADVAAQAATLNAIASL